MTPFLPTRTLLVAGVFLLVGGLVATPAWAHEGNGTFAVEQSNPTGDLAVDYVVRLTWDNDGHAAADSTVTATALDTGGTPQTPVPLTPMDDDGRYQGTVTFPSAGSWTVRFTSVSPVGTLETTTEVAAPTTEAPPADGTTPRTDDTPSSTDRSEFPEAESASAESDASDSDGWLLPAVVIVVFAVLVVGAVLALRARRSVP